MTRNFQEGMALKTIDLSNTKSTMGLGSGLFLKNIFVTFEEKLTERVHIIRFIETLKEIRPLIREKEMNFSRGGQRLGTVGLFLTLIG